MNIINKLVQYVKNSISELKKVAWPSKKQTKNYSIIVVGMSIGVAVFFAFLDNIFNYVIDILIR